MNHPVVKQVRSCVAVESQSFLYAVFLANNPEETANGAVLNRFNEYTIRVGETFHRSITSEIKVSYSRKGSI